MQHIRTAGWVYEDATWLNAHYSFTGDLSTLKDSIPSKDLALFTFTPNHPKIAHSINLAIHIINVILLIMLINDLTDAPHWIVGSLFLINPLTIQAIAYAAGRAELLSFTGLLLFLWFGTASVMHFHNRWIGLIISVLIMLTTKPTIIIVAPFLLIWIWYNEYYYNWLPNLDIKLFCVCLLALLFLTPNIMVQVHSTITKWDWFRVQTAASFKLIPLAITGYGLSIDHPWWLVSYSISIVAIICAIIIGVIILIKKNTMTFGIGWFMICIMPRLITPNYLGWIREHHMYVPAAGICIALGAIFNERS